MKKTLIVYTLLLPPTEIKDPSQHAIVLKEEYIHTYVMLVASVNLILISNKL